MEVEDDSVKPTENNCDWCGKSCGSEKYCCNKCKHEHNKSTLPARIGENVGVGVVGLFQTVAILLYYLVTFLVVVVILVIVHVGLCYTNSTYFSLANYIVNYFHQSRISQGISITNLGMIEAILWVSPTLIRGLAVHVKSNSDSDIDIYFRWYGVVFGIIFLSALSNFVWPAGNSITHLVILVIGSCISTYRVWVE